MVPTNSDALSKANPELPIFALIGNGAFCYTQLPPATASPKNTAYDPRHCVE